MFIWSSTCFGGHTAHHQEHTCTSSLWFCICEMLSDVVVAAQQLVGYFYMNYLEIICCIQSMWMQFQWFAYAEQYKDSDSINGEHQAKEILYMSRIWWEIVVNISSKNIMSLSLLLLHNHSGNTVGHDQKFWTTVTVKQHIKKWCIQYNVIYLGNYLGPEKMSKTCR
jgi:hypothetical protein